jgi:hypothetical protein
MGRSSYGTAGGSTDAGAIFRRRGTARGAICVLHPAAWRVSTPRGSPLAQSIYFSAGLLQFELLHKEVVQSASREQRRRRRQFSGHARRSGYLVRHILRKLRKRVGPLDIYFGNLQGQNLADAETFFFTALQLSNGTFKTTSPHRLDDLNELVTSLLPRGRRLDVMDVAVSSGVATAEWSAHLSEKGIPHCVTAGDLAVEGRLMTLGRRGAILWQDDGHPMVVQWGHRCAYLMTGHLVTRTMAPVLGRVYPLIPKRWTASPSTPPRAWRIRVRSVGLVSARLASVPGITVVKDDISRPGRYVGSFDACRAANILNQVYFPDRVIRDMAGNLIERLRDGGLLVACRTVNENSAQLNRATVLRRVRGSVEVVGRLNGGSDVEHLLLGAAPPLTAVSG